ncbi:GNAT family N-acetyltransferase [Streptomyces sp. HNM0574]|uniref:GNAT family N-acetyltransferase n=1 Tax=Streptomyces sp. HNM0574 TaxID=2714954 RepID=UPI00146F8D5C|nr:GNAT family N-acetyltransferase [Streptomyces sp. HNM0574]NLU69040.1 GNAT family N-acetyltransferase [Streptomyces sp. HNM0574]
MTPDRPDPTEQIRVRPFRPGDAEGVAAVRRAAVPQLVCTARTVAWQAAHAPPARRARWLVAECARGRITGYAEAALAPEGRETGQGLLNVAVHPEAAGLGTGGALAAAGERHLREAGARDVHTRVSDDGYSPAFAERRGYRPGHPTRFLALDLTRAALPPVPPASALAGGIVLGTAAGLGRDLRPLYEADVECAADEPGAPTAGFPPYAEWLGPHRDRPDLDHGLSTVALAGREVVAYTLARTDGRERYWSAMTGCRRAYRGLGLARLVKLDSLHRARAAGYARAVTCNDGTNAPMLAVNRALGYAPAGAQWRYVKEL